MRWLCGSCIEDGLATVRSSRRMVLRSKLCRMGQEATLRRLLAKVDRQSLIAFGFDLGLGVAAAVLLTAPAVLLIDSRVMGYPHDGFAYMWKMWWTRKALLELHISPADMRYVNYPYPGYNPHLIASPLINVLALPLIGWLGPLRTYNLLMLAAFALSWPTAALLCYEFSRNRWAASVGGAAYAFYANKVAHAVGGHLAQMFVFLLPLSALFLYRAWRTPQRRSHAILAGAFLGLSALVDLKHVALFVVPFVGLFLLFHGLVERRQWNRVRVVSMATVLAVATLSTAPFLVPLVAGRLAGRLEHFYATGVVRHSADLTGFFVPPPEHPLYANLEPLRAYSERLAAAGWHENIFYLGIVALALAVAAGWKRRHEREVQFWVIAALVGMVLALGPFLKVGGGLATLQVEEYVGYIPLPYYLLQRLPFYDWGRTPGRIIEVTMLALAVLAAYGAADVLSRFRGGHRPVVALGLIALVLADSLFVWPWPLGDAEVPAFYRQIALEAQDYAVLDLPLWEYRCERYQLYYATIHGHRIVGGSVTRRSPEAETAMRAVERLVQADAAGAPAESLAELGIRYVVLHKLCLEEAGLNAQTALLEKELGRFIYDDRWIRAFEVPGNPGIEPGAASAPHAFPSGVRR